jgi:hypothetical protein
MCSRAKADSSSVREPHRLRKDYNLGSRLMSKHIAAAG